MMVFSKANAEFFVPDGAGEAEALQRTTVMIVGAHQDDVEFMGFPLIKDAFASGRQCLGAVVATNGAGSARAGRYADYTDEQMQAVRREEQRLAARLGRYAFAAQLQFSSAEIKNRADPSPTRDLARIFEAACPEVVMTHNLLDRHGTHVATALRVIEAIKTLPPAKRPKVFYGGECWRDLDWVPSALKVRLDAGGHDSLAAGLMGCFDSQIAGGKRYDLATFGRWRANATYDESHAVDVAQEVSFALDMGALIAENATTAAEYVEKVLAAFSNEARTILGF